MQEGLHQKPFQGPDATLPALPGTVSSGTDGDGCSGILREEQRDGEKEKSAGGRTDRNQADGPGLSLPALGKGRTGRNSRNPARTGLNPMQDGLHVRSIREKWAECTENAAETGWKSIEIE